jgi:hypothetical protein
MIVEKIGIKWAKRISAAYLAWAKSEKKSRTLAIKPFDPSPFIESTFYDSGEAQLGAIGKLVGMEVSFDLKSQTAIDWVKKYSADQVKHIDQTQKMAVRQVKLSGLQDGLSIQEQKVLIKQSVGLLPQHVIAVDTFKQGLLDSGTLIEDATLQADRYAVKLLTYRANMIAVTEGMTASNEGHRQTNIDAVERGIIDPDEYKQMWVVSGLPNVCDECLDANGTRSDIGGLFPNGTLGPPLHPHDHCGTILVKREE